MIIEFFEFFILVTSYKRKIELLQYKKKENKKY